MRKDGLENLTLRGHTESKRSRKKQRITHLISLSEWIEKQKQRMPVKGQKLFKATKEVVESNVVYLLVTWRIKENVLRKIATTSHTYNQKKDSLNF